MTKKMFLFLSLTKSTINVCISQECFVVLSNTTLCNCKITLFYKLCFLNKFVDSCFVCKSRIFRKRIYYNVSLCMESKKSVRKDELFWSDEFSSSLFTVGVVRILTVARQLSSSGFNG